MKISVIAGSHRRESQSARVGRYIEDELKKLGASTFFLSLAENPIPLWDEDVWAGSEKWSDLWGPISKELGESAGAVVVSPEWSGMAPAGLKNFFLLCSKELSHKPAMLVGVSSSIGGAYPIAELRMSSYKNTRICYMPDHVIVRNAESMLKPGVPTDKHDENLRARITYTAKVLLEYSKAFTTIRESGVIDMKTFPNGM